MAKKSKTNIYILLPVVIALWGTIFYKVFWGNGGDEPLLMEVQPVNMKVSKQVEASTDFQLKLNYADPFLGTQYVKKKVAVATKKSKPSRNRALANWPGVSYNGCISNDKGELAHLLINGRTSLVAKDAIVNEISVLEITADSILLKCQSEKKWFKKFR
ncbi:hypothetical protein EYV94_27630 [Puteibacter caeruleilacunae]|nr:hypothetical protein EYV94_27630 [Puteibacter caeruleilacunae]